MLTIGAKVRTTSGYTGVVEIMFRDGSWARKFIDCPWCDRSTWEVDIAEADLTATGTWQYLIVDDLGRWRLVDSSRVSPARDPAFTAVGEISLNVKLGGTNGES
jgi:hypothetical protein